MSAKVVLPAPGVATARKSARRRPTKRSRAAFCHGLSRTMRVIGTADASDRSCRRVRESPAPPRGYSRATAPVASRPPRQTERKGCTSMRKRITLLLLSVAVLAATAAVSQLGRPAATSSAALASCATGSLNLVTDGQLHDRHRQPGLPAVVRRRLAEGLVVEDQRPGDRQGLRVGRRLRGREAARLRASPQVKWTYVPFNRSFAPGQKSFDFDINQISYHAGAREGRHASARRTTTSTRRSSSTRARRSPRCARSRA